LLEKVAHPFARLREPYERRSFSKGQILNLCCGLFGVQIVWGLQNANTSRIFQTLGARVDDLPILWIAGPIAGLLVQPIIGEWSDRTTGRWGRRRPFMTVGALLTALALMVMANAGTVFAAALALWLLTFSINIVMEPFRALMGDLAPADSRDRGFAMQVLFIGAGAVLASALPWIFVHWLAIAPAGTPGQMAPAVRASFLTGAAGLLLTVMWTVMTTPERPLLANGRSRAESMTAIDRGPGSQVLKRGAAWTLLGIAIAVANGVWTQRREGYLLAAVIALFGGLHWLAGRSFANARNPLVAIATEVIGMPRAMRRLALVQFFTWFALFALWVYAVPAVAQRYYGDPAPGSIAYESAANWVGVLFAVYNGVAAFAALALPRIAAGLGRGKTHALFLAVAAIGLTGLVAAPTTGWLWLAVVAIGLGWASILAIPYAIVAAVVPPDRMGVYMGIHNVFLVLPQLAAAAILGPLVRVALHGNVAGAIIVAGGAMLAGSAVALTIPTID
jgi:maltose/moltooligosaccharide transporter